MWRTEPGTSGCAPVDGQSGKQFFRLSIAFYPKEKLVDGAKRLCQALKDYIATQKIPHDVS